MDIEDLFEIYMHSPSLLEELRTEFEFSTVEDVYQWLKDFPAGSEAVLMDYFESYEELKTNCEKILNANNPN